MPFELEDSFESGVVIKCRMRIFSVSRCVNKYSTTDHEHSQHEHSFLKKRCEGLGATYGVNGKSQCRKIK